MIKTTTDTLNSMVEFDCAFQIHPGQYISHSNIYAPSVYFEGECDDQIEIDSDDWEAVTGYSGQWQYSGPIMHPSEYLAGAIAAYVIDNPGVYAVTEVMDFHSDDNLDSDPIGWILIRYTGENK